MVTHMEVRCFQNLKLKSLLEKPSNLLRSMEKCDLSKFHLLQSEVPIGAAKNYKVLSKLHHNGELNFLANFDLTFFSLKKILR